MARAKPCSVAEGHGCRAFSQLYRESALRARIFTDLCINYVHASTSTVLHCLPVPVFLSVWSQTLPVCCSYRGGGRRKRRRTDINSHHSRTDLFRSVMDLAIPIKPSISCSCYSKILGALRAPCLYSTTGASWHFRWLSSRVDFTCPCTSLCGRLFRNHVYLQICFAICQI